MAKVTTVLLDLDGVVRHFDPEHRAGIERAHGLAAGSLMKTAFEPELLNRVLTGQMPRRDWVVEVGERIGNPVAAAEWMSQPAAVDQDMVAEVATLRSRGVVVAILTNGTDTTTQEMIDHGLDTEFDAIYNSAEIGFAKPDPRVFQFVCDSLAVDPTQVFFTDDSESKLAGAIEIGMTARRFEGLETFRQHLSELGLG